MIFCFTATGNSLYAARALDKDVRSIPHVLKEKKPLAFHADAIGIVCPVQAILMKPTLGFTEKNPDVRYRNPNVSLGDLVRANG